MHDDLFTLHDKFQCAFQDVRDLLILVAMQRHDRTFPQDQPGEHASFARNKLAIDQWIQVFYGHVLEAYVL